MSTRSDAELVEAFQRGEERAFNELALRYQEKLYWVARRFTNDHAQADDIVQESLVKAYQALRDFRGESGVFTWLYRIVVNASLNAIRRQRIREVLRLDEVYDEEASPEASPHDAVEKQEEQRLIEEAIERLPEKQKAVFVLRYYDELPYEQISEILKTSVGGLKANYFHAIRKIARYVQNAHETP